MTANVRLAHVAFSTAHVSSSLSAPVTFSNATLVPTHAASASLTFPVTIVGTVQNPTGNVRIAYIQFSTNPVSGQVFLTAPVKLTASLSGASSSGSVPLTAPVSLTAATYTGAARIGYITFGATQGRYAWNGSAWVNSQQLDVLSFLVAPVTLSAGVSTIRVASAALTAPASLTGSANRQTIIGPVSLNAPASLSAGVNDKEIASASLVAGVTLTSAAQRIATIGATLGSAVAITAGANRQAVVAVSLGAPVNLTATLTGYLFGLVEMFAEIDLTASSTANTAFTVVPLTAEVDLSVNPLQGTSSLATVPLTAEIDLSAYTDIGGPIGGRLRAPVVLNASAFRRFNVGGALSAPFNVSVSDLNVVPPQQKPVIYVWNGQAWVRSTISIWHNNTWADALWNKP